ncbi:hypothetical protein ACLOJK_021176 [Asimina triloba]
MPTRLLFFSGTVHLVAALSPSPHLVLLCCCCCPKTMFSIPIPSLHLVRSLPLISSPRPPSGISSNCTVVFHSPLQTKNFSSSSSSRCYFSSELNGNSVGGGGSGRNGNLAIEAEGRNLNFSITRKKRCYGGGPSQAEELVPILNDCSIRIPTGQLWMLHGPNGCGKSTLLKVASLLCFSLTIAH